MQTAFLKKRKTYETPQGREIFLVSWLQEKFPKEGKPPGHQTVQQRPCSSLECRRHFIERVRLNRHLRVHIGEKPYEFSWCGKQFRRKGNLVVHQKIHTGERTFVCLEYRKSFGEKAKLIYHHRVYMGEKLYACAM